MIKAVIFDFFGVICSDNYWRLTKSGKQSEPVFNEYANQVNLGSIPWQAFVKKVAAATGTSIEKVNKMYESESIDPRIIGLIQHLRGDYKIGLISNANKGFTDKLLKPRGLEKLFDSIVISSEIGAIKPDPRIYRRSLEELGIDASEAVFIDDKTQHVNGARQVGMKALLYEDFQILQTELSETLSGS